MEHALSYLIIDDDHIHNRLCTMGIKKYHPAAEVTSIEDPVAALEYIKNQYPATDGRFTIMLLDLNMPVLTGWEFLDQFAYFNENIRSQFDIYILTSSVSNLDKEKARENSAICGFLEKPLTAYQLDSMVLVKKMKESHLNPHHKHENSHVAYSHINDQERQLLDIILQNFELNEVLNVQKCIRGLKNESAIDLHNSPINLYADNIKAFLIANDFAYNLSGDPLINKKGMDLMSAGSLHNYEKV